MIKNGLWCKKCHKPAHFSILHTDVHDRLDDHIHTPQATFPSNHKNVATTLGLPQSTTKRWLQRATWRRTTSGDRVVRRLVCVSFPFCMFRLTSLGVSCVRLVCGSMAVMRSALLPQRSSTPGFLLSHVAQSLVSANVCKRLGSSAAAAASRGS